MSLEILCTLGPASLKKTVLERLNDLPVNLLRINLSHTAVNQLSELIPLIQNATPKPICIDTEGAQVRTGKVIGGQVFLSEGSYLNIYNKKIPGNAQQITFFPPESVDQMEISDLISIDFNSVLAQVVEKKPGLLKAKIVTEGIMGSNKAVSVNRPILMDPLSSKDKEAIKIAKEYGIKHFALSFASRVEDVRLIRKLTSEDSFIISKIENSSGVTNAAAIARESNAVLIDRGDLSREKPIETIPLLQKYIIETAKKQDAKVYVATNLLETMVTQAKPTRAEVNDVFNTLLDGADGLVLAAETAIGVNPIGCINMISRLIGQYENYSRFGMDIKRIDQQSLLIEPHGGELINGVSEKSDIKEIDKLPELKVGERVLLDCEQIADGVYSPIKGFMNRDEIESVLEKYQLPSGDVWTLPIYLQIPESEAKRFQKGNVIALSDEVSGKRFATLNLEDVFTLNLEQFAQKMFGTTSKEHPGASQLISGGNTFLGGEIRLVNRLPKPGAIKSYILKPKDTRVIFEHKNWFRIVGFHTRNVIHKGHEFIQLKALEDYHCDGLFVSPAIGPKKKNDFMGEIVLRAYQAMVDYNLYPKNRVLIGAFSSYSRYAGPREAVFTALCRKNFGCSHFVLGRDHTGVKDFYAPDAVAKLFDTIGDIGIVPVFYGEVAYSPENRSHFFVENKPSSDVFKISGSIVRDLLQNGEGLPSWLLREDVSETLMEAVNNGEKIFVD
jgi:pyruvate kinase